MNSNSIVPRSVALRVASRDPLNGARAASIDAVASVASADNGENEVEPLEAETVHTAVSAR